MIAFLQLLQPNPRYWLRKTGSGNALSCNLKHSCGIQWLIDSVSPGEHINESVCHFVLYIFKFSFCVLNIDESWVVSQLNFKTDVCFKLFYDFPRVIKQLVLTTLKIAFVILRMFRHTYSPFLRNNLSNISSCAMYLQYNEAARMNLLIRGFS